MILKDRLICLLVLFMFANFAGCHKARLTCDWPVNYEPHEMEPSVPTENDLFCLSNVMSRCEVQPSTNVLFFVWYLPWDYECIGALYWMDEINEKWQSATFMVPTNAPRGASFGEGFSIVQKGEPEKVGAELAVFEARRVIQNAHYRRSPFYTKLDRAREVLGIWRGDRWLFCTSMGSDTEEMRLLIEMIMNTAAKANELGSSPPPPFAVSVDDDAEK